MNSVEMREMGEATRDVALGMMATLVFVGAIAIDVFLIIMIIKASEKNSRQHHHSSSDPLMTYLLIDHCFSRPHRRHCCRRDNLAIPQEALSSVFAMAVLITVSFILTLIALILSFHAGLPILGLILAGTWLFSAGLFGTGEMMICASNRLVTPQGIPIAELVTDIYNDDPIPSAPPMPSSMGKS